eukprot:gene2545-biopygen2768
MFPASSPFVLSVGGTMGLESNTFPEKACSVENGAPFTAGGGFSEYFPTPAWQHEAVGNYFNRLPEDKIPKYGFHLSGRAYPDVSLAAVDYPVVIGGKVYLVSGTSASAPVVAGMISLINSELLEEGQPPVGFINPLLYASKGEFANDITVGSSRCPSKKHCCSEGFESTEGWDPVTGFGSIHFPALKRLLKNPSAIQRERPGEDEGAALNVWNKDAFFLLLFICFGILGVARLMLKYRWAYTPSTDSSVTVTPATPHLLSTHNCNTSYFYSLLGLLFGWREEEGGVNGRRRPHQTPRRIQLWSTKKHTTSYDINSSQRQHLQGSGVDDRDQQPSYGSL